MVTAARTALLKARTVRRKPSAFTSSSFAASSSSVCGPHLGHAVDAVLGPQQVEPLRVEDLPGELPGLLEDGAAVLGVGEAVEVGALVDEAAAVGVDEDAEGIGVVFELGGDRARGGLGS